jgi:hypothetical protein
MLVIAAVKDDEVFEQTIVSFSDSDRGVRREIRAAVLVHRRRSNHIRGSAGTRARESGGEGARAIARL